MDFLFLRRLLEVDGVILTHYLADATFPFFEVEAAFVDIFDQRNGLGEVNMDRFILRYFLVIFVWILDRAILHAVRATRAFVFENISGLFCQRDLEISRLPIYAINFRVGEDFDVRMPADLDQFRCENSHRTFVGGKGLVELCHVSADAWRFLDQIDLEASVGKIKRRLNAANPSADDHDVADIAVSFFFHLL